MNRAYFLNSDALRRVLAEEQFRLPLSHTMALHAIARLHGFKTWNAAAVSALNQQALKNQAKVLKDQLGATADGKFLPPDKLATLCSALNAVEMEAFQIQEQPAVLAELSAEERELLGFFGAGASTAELYAVLERRPDDFTLVRLHHKIGASSDLKRDEFARQHGLVLPAHGSRLATLRQKRRPIVSPDTALNLAGDVQVRDLKALIAAQDDDAGHHTLWVDRRGTIHLDVVPDDMSPVLYEREIDNQLQFRIETFDQGNGYMGSVAAKDELWITDLLTSLQRLWATRAVGYIETY